MKVLHLAQYIYRQEYPEFTKNKSGLGIMVDDICKAVSRYDEVHLLTHAITDVHKSEYLIVGHSWHNVLKNLRVSDVVRGIKQVLLTKTNLRNKFHLAFYEINCGCLKRELSEFVPDVVHIHEYTPAMQPFIKYCLKNKVPMLVTCHGLLYEKDCARYIKDAEADIARKYNENPFIITVISSAIKKKLLRYYPIKDEKNIRVVLNGVEAAKQSGENEHKLEKRKKYSLLCVGQLSDRKNQMQIVRAINLMDQEIRDQLEVLFIGNDTLHGVVQNRIKELKLDNVIKCIGFVDRKELYQYYGNADGLVMASKDEGFGLPIVEAMTYGVPSVVFSDIDAFSDLYSTECMIPVDERSDEKLKEAIVKLMNTKWDKVKIRECGEKFSTETMGERYHQCYEEVRKGELNWG